MIKNIKSQIGIFITIIIILLFNIVDLSSLYALGDSSPYANEKLTIYELEKLYHKRINDLFNSKLKLLHEGSKGSGTGQAPQGDECPDNNYSTYCLSLSAAKEFEQFQTAMLKKKQIVEIPEGSNLNLQEVSLKAIAAINEIDSELARAKTALDAALATYNELRIMYPMHLQFEEMIKNLTEYNKKIIEFRKNAEKLPPSFVDSTTSQCV
ncbi:hypothetical protein JW911_01140 [Candidatus Peregrinibacteria bacterium]|nr:hypothetical protein [Candidatus Peregrinibacteria bacterium]